MRYKAFVAALAACSMFASGCTKQGARSETLVVSQVMEPRSLNPILIEGTGATDIGALVFSYLLTIDDRGNLQPSVALRVPTVANGGISRDGRTITYALRPGVRWQDGQPLTARDVVFTYSAIVNPRNLVPTRFVYDRIVSVTAPNDRTVVVKLRAPYAPILNYFMAPAQNFEILPAHLLARYADLNHVSFNSEPVGSGPYRVVQWVRGDHMLFEANPHYFQGAPRIKTILWRFIPSTSTTITQLQTREVNAYFYADAAAIDQYGRIPGVSIARKRVNDMAAILFNTSDPALHDVRVRRGIVAAIDRANLVRKTTRGSESPNDAGRGMFSAAYDPAYGGNRYDPSQARALLESASRPSTLELAIPTGSPDAESVALNVQQELRTYGINVTVRSYAETQLLAPIGAGGPLATGKYQMAYLRFQTTGDADVSWFFACNQQPPNGFNDTRICDPEADRAQALANASYDATVRQRYESIVQKRIEDDAPYLPLWQTNAVFIYPSNLENFRPSAFSPYWNARDWTL